jgi:hypothetical protein
MTGTRDGALSSGAGWAVAAGALPAGAAVRAAPSSAGGSAVTLAAALAAGAGAAVRTGATRCRGCGRSTGGGAGSDLAIAVQAGCGSKAMAGAVAEADVALVAAGLALTAGGAIAMGAGGVRRWARRAPATTTPTKTRPAAAPRSPAFLVDAARALGRAGDCGSKRFATTGGRDARARLGTGVPPPGVASKNGMDGLGGRRLPGVGAGALSRAAAAAASRALPRALASAGDAVRGMISDGGLAPASVAAIFRRTRRRAREGGRSNSFVDMGSCLGRGEGGSHRLKRWTAFPHRSSYASTDSNPMVFTPPPAGASIRPMPAPARAASIALALAVGLVATPSAAAPARARPSAGVAGAARLPSDVVKRLQSSDPGQVKGALDDARISGKAGAPAVPAIVELLDRGMSPVLTRAAIETLGDVESEPAGAALFFYARHRDVALRRAAVQALTRTGGALATKALRLGLTDPDPGVRGLSAAGLGTLRAREAIFDLFAALDHRVAEASGSIGQICTSHECDKLAEKLGALPFGVVTAGLDRALFRPAAEVSEDAKVKIVGRIRELGTGEANHFLRDVQGRWKKERSARVKQAIDQAVLATSGSPGVTQ